MAFHNGALSNARETCDDTAPRAVVRGRVAKTRDWRLSRRDQTRRMRGIVGGAEPGGFVDSHTGPVAGTKWTLVERADGVDNAGATCERIRSGAAVPNGVSPACALQSCSPASSMRTPVEEGAGSSHCSAAGEPWCAEPISTDEPQTIAHSTPETGTAARTTSAT